MPPRQLRFHFPTETQGPIQETLRIGEISVPLTIIHRARKTFSIRVTPECAVVVTVPVGLARKRIDDLIATKLPWIEKHLAMVRATPPPPERTFTHGEVHRYLGKDLVLHVAHGPRTKVTHAEGVLHVVCPRADVVGPAVERWFRAEAARVFDMLAAPWLQVFRGRGHTPSAITVRAMRTRWGSCSTKGRISLSVFLVAAPPECIEYVIVHELCHLIEHNHSRRFYALQESYISDWKARKQALRRVPRF